MDARGIEAHRSLHLRPEGRSKGKVTADAAGELAFHAGHSTASDFVDLTFEMNTLMVLSTAPHPLDPAESYQPGSVSLALFEKSASATAECMQIAENQRASQNTQRFYACCGGDL